MEIKWYAIKKKSKFDEKLTLVGIHVKNFDFEKKL